LSAILACFSWPSGTTIGPLETVSWYPSCSQEKTSWTSASRGGDEQSSQWVSRHSTLDSSVCWWALVPAYQVTWCL